MFQSNSTKIQNVYIPKKLRKMIVNKIHKGHQGYLARIRYAKERVFWIGMTKDMKKCVDNCEILEANRNQKEILILRDTPKSPWCVVAADVLEYSSKLYW